ncbi:g3243 [Coccomyxa viridis]|uniref:Homoserine kinase n=1 Tax=Coccomyxa viridis TaxID=1274662 RepID=A0ABP1FMB6_9CHLO
MGCAVEGEGDTVIATVLPDRPGHVEIASIEGDGGRLTLEAPKNCVGIAAIETLKLLGQTSCGVSLRLQKGLPLGSGMGSSAASAAAGAWAVNSLFGSPLSKQDLVPAGLASEAIVSGYHADNIAPALLGGFVLIRSCNPLDIQQLTFPGDLWFVLVNPVFEAPTAEMRAVLPKQVAMSSAVHNCAMGGSLVAGILQGSAMLIGKALDSDCIVEPVRGPLIPGFAAVKRAAKAAGAYGCTISGAGPTCVAVTDGKEQGERIAQAMVQAFRESGPLEVNSARVVKLDQTGVASRPTSQQ